MMKIKITCRTISFAAMAVLHTDLLSLPVFKNAVITIGTFDGVHKGHREVIKCLKEAATAINGESVIITFNPHPRQVIPAIKEKVYLLNTREEKIHLLQQLGSDYIIEVPFNHDFLNLSAESYISSFLVQNFHPRKIIIGYDHRFGNGRLGDFKMLEQYAGTFDYEVLEIPEELIQEIAISSTRIRKALLEGKVEEANKNLGYLYFLSGTVVEGNKLGRTIGFPTANLQVLDAEKLIPANGVYAVDVKLNDGKNLKGMMNIGIRPTVDGTNRVIEVNIFDFDEDIYGQQLTVFLKTKIRDEQKFAGIDALKQQLAKDKEVAITK